MRGKPDGIGVDSSLSTPPLEVWKLFASELLKRGRNMGISPPFRESRNRDGISIQ